MEQECWVLYSDVQKECLHDSQGFVAVFPSQQIAELQRLDAWIYDDAKWRVVDAHQAIDILQRNKCDN